MKEKHKKLLQSLINNYKSIHEETLVSMWKKHEGLLSPIAEAIMAELTGFGDVLKCVVCSEHKSCETCPYFIYTGTMCNSGSNEKSYDAISFATDPAELYLAIQDRIAHIQLIINQSEEL